MSLIDLEANLDDPLYHRAIRKLSVILEELKLVTPHVQSNFEAAEPCVVDPCGNLTLSQVRVRVVSLFCAIALNICGTKGGSGRRLRNYKHVWRVVLEGTIRKRFVHLHKNIARFGNPCDVPFRSYKEKKKI